MRQALRFFASDRRGAAAIEFGLLAPLLILLLLGVLQVGFAMQAYNSLRNASADTARDVSVQYQTDNRIDESQIAELAVAHATTAPYFLKSDRFDVLVREATTQQIANAQELQMIMFYRLPSFLEFAGIEMPEIRYEQAIFVSKSSS